MKLSVCVITYDHEAYLAHALDGALAQRTDFDFEIVVGEDCSKDGTRDVLKAYAARYPNKIRPLLREKNIGINRNLVSTLEACRGEYIALLEGDDYWTNTDKLARQVAVLDADKTLSLAFHDVLVRAGERFVARTHAPFSLSNRYTFRGLLRNGNFMPTCSVVFRRGLFDAFPDWYFTLRIGDYPLHLFNAEHGDIARVPGLLGVYRRHAGGTYSAADPARNIAEACRMMELLGTHFEHRYDDVIAPVIAFWQARELFRQGRVDEGREQARRVLGERPIGPRVATAALMAHAPRLYQSWSRAQVGLGRLGESVRERWRTR